MRSNFLLLCLLLSGASGLAYELLWTRVLALSFGSTLLSFSTVIAVFFGGLALGAYGAGKKVSQLERPVRAYAIIELATGIFGLVLHPVLSRLGPVFASIDPGTGPGAAFARLAVAAPLLLIPTMLMGATLPVVARAMITRDEDVGRGTALIYGFNTAGACLGAYLISYHLLLALGVWRSNLAAAMINFLAAGIALLADRSTAPQPVAAQPIARDSRFSWMIALAFFTGFSAIAFQIVWVRIFSIFLEGTTYAVSAVLICVLVGIAAGSLFSARVRAGSFWFVALQLGMIASILVISGSLLRIGYQLREITWPNRAGLDVLHAQLAICLLVLFVPTFCSGASFPILVRIAEHRAAATGRALGYLYAANTIGGITGSLLTGFVLLPIAGSEATVLVALAVTALVAASGAGLLVSGRRRLPGLAVAALAIFSLKLYDGLNIKAVSIAVTHQGIFAEYLRKIEDRVRTLIYFSEGEAATVAVYDSGSDVALSLNGLPQGARFDAPPHHGLESTLVALLPWLHSAQAERAAVIGLGTGSTAKLLRELGPKQVEVLEIEPRVAGAARIIFPEEQPRLVITDARHYFLLNRTKLDLITSMPAHPWISPGLFTSEFFELARENLTERGVFCTWFGAPRLDATAIQSLFRAFTGVFSNYVIYWMPSLEAYYLVGSKSPLALDPRRPLTHPDIADHEGLSDPYYFALRVVASGDAQTPPLPEGIVNTDDSAHVELIVPRSGAGAAAASSGFMPREYLSPSMIPEPGRREFFLELIERQLNQPDVARARRTFQGAEALFSESDRQYFRGRLEPTEAGLKALAEAAREGSDDVRPRAEKFLALRTGKLEELAERAPATDVLLALIELNPLRARSLVPKEAPADPLGWFLWWSVHGPPGPASAEDRDNFTRRVGPLLAKSDKPALLAWCMEVALARVMEREAAACARWRGDRLRARADELRKRAAVLGARGEFARAAELLEEARSLAPGDSRTTELLLRTRVELKDEAAVEALSRELVFLGRSARYVDWLVKQAKARKLTGSREGVDESSATGDSGESRDGLR